MTLFDHLRIALGTFCLALSFHPFLASTIETRENIDCQIWTLGGVDEPHGEPTFKCGGAEIAMIDDLIPMGIIHGSAERLNARIKTRWLRCRLTEKTAPIVFGYVPALIIRSISACKPLVVAPASRRWLCFMAERGSCHA